jgi:diguanylate cyclase (GGDEF)-like protein
MSGFPITNRRSGVLAWDGKSKPDEIAGYLRKLSPHTRDLVENAESYERIEAMSYTDSLTGLNNQRYFHKRLSEETSRATRYKRSLGLIIFDLDDLKSINDRFGHLAGDTTLKRLGQILKSSIRAIDIIARYGGDEFCVIMPEADGATCERFMERLKQKISSSKFNIAEADQELHCTISQGAALFPDHASTETELMHVADMALLRAKESGRNTYFLYDTENWPKMV